VPISSSHAEVSQISVAAFLFYPYIALGTNPGISGTMVALRPVWLAPAGVVTA
jgi:hypothetical protein